MPTDNYLNRGSIAKDAIREREMLAARKKAAGGIVNSPRTGAAPAPQTAPAQPYAPPLTVQEITQKFMGGPAVQPTGIPQQSAQNPAPAAPQAPAPTQPLLRPDQQDRLSAQRARVSAGATQRDYKRAFDSGAGADELNRIGQNMDDYRRIDAGYQAQQSGAPGPAFTQERTDAGRARLQEQAARIAAERNGQPLPGDTDTWSYEAGQKALPKELQGQKFTHPQDQANYRDFSRFVGGAPSIDPATGQMTTPADREYKSVQQLREEEIMARRKAAQPIDFAPFNPEEAQKNQAAATARYQETLRAAEAARGRVGQREGDYRTTAEAPTTVGAQMTRAQIAEQEKLRERAKADTSLIPGEAAAKGANDRLSALIAEGKARGLPQEEAVQQAKNALAIAEANAKAGAAPRMIEATTKAAEGEAGVKAATAGIQQKQLENYGKPGGTMDTAQRAADATNSASADRAVADAAAAKYGSPDRIIKDAEAFMGNMKRRFNTPFDPFGLTTGRADINITGPRIEDDLSDLEILDRGVTQKLEAYATMDPIGASSAANAILSNMPTPGSDGMYATKVGNPLPSLQRYVDKLNTIRSRLKKISDAHK